MRQGLRGKKAGGGLKRPVARRPQKPPKATVQAKQLDAKKAPKGKASKDRESEKRLAQALEQQAATSEILRVISQSPSDVQPAFDTIVGSAVRLCVADYSIAARFDGELLHPLADHGFSPEALEVLARMFPMRPSGESLLQRVALTRAVVNSPLWVRSSN